MVIDRPSRHRGLRVTAVASPAARRASAPTCTPRAGSGSPRRRRVARPGRPPCRPRISSSTRPPAAPDPGRGGSEASTPRRPFDGLTPWPRADNEGVVPDAPGSLVRQSEVISALSRAVDLTEGQPMGHAARTCMIGMRLAADAGLDATDRSALFYALLLKDVGCSSTAARVSELLGGDDLEFKARAEADRLEPPGAGGAPHRGLGRRVRRLARLPRAAPAGRRAGRLRCDRGAQILRLLGFRRHDRAAARRALGRARQAGRPPR